MIAAQGVTKRYPGHDALADLSFDIAAGEFVFLLGHSGAGKSTLLKLLIARERPTRGSLVVNQHNVARLPPRQLPRYRRGIGIVFQDHKLLPERTVADNVALPLIVAGVGAAEIQKRTAAALDKVGLLNKAKLRPPSLSAGEQQRVGIARAVVNRPPLLLADEPTGNLDAELSDRIFDLFAEFNRYGTTVVIATHDRRQVARLHPRVLHLNNGSLVAAPTAA